jgi:hypothetical protein
MASRLMEASSRMAVCGQPPVSTPDYNSYAVGGQTNLLPRKQELRVLTRVSRRDHASSYNTAPACASQSDSHERGLGPEPTVPPMPKTLAGPWESRRITKRKSRASSRALSHGPRKSVALRRD